MLDKFSTEKKKQVLYSVAAVGVLVSAFLLLSSAFKKDVPQAVIDEPKLNIVDKKDTDAKTFRKEYADKDAEKDAKLKKLQEELEALKSGGLNNQGQVQSQALPGQQQLPNSQYHNGTANQVNTLSSMLTPPPPPTAAIPASLPEPAPTKQETPKSVVMGDMIGMISGAAPAPEVKVSEGAGKSNSEIKKVEIPSGSFMGGIILSGIDAPTGGKAKTSPHPVLIKVTNMARLPNKFKANLKECHVLGSGYGDLSSERAFVRIEKISCMTEDGRAIEKGGGGQSLGYVTGEDGKVGIPGRVVSKQGAMLARTLAAGFLEGVSKGFNSSNMTYSIQPTGTVQTPNPNDTLQMGLMGGVGEASKKLADFYMKLANEMFPVVEVAAGRKVDMILLEKMTFDIDEKGLK